MDLVVVGAHIEYADQPSAGNLVPIEVVVGLNGARIDDSGEISLFAKEFLDGLVRGREPRGPWVWRQGVFEFQDSLASLILLEACSDSVAVSRQSRREARMQRGLKEQERESVLDNLRRKPKIEKELFASWLAQ